ncbi:conserved hypothetical protein [Deferribacter desulfuricans SSM1]|uniref:Cytoplasmic chaperone TorD n=1 Tax=Deferribacter desulfuricans (strain DSM 14783 / JCM 11476 / NBRC 101012 / SSM1) TaxID=639282 RepID=D3PDX3_DEFDS|nr:molecular chaperone TorD family protein [Deferribacter desulfuricans]BAI80796.1 conserved hypothetical protein [Deferribacter desulfuricans SSM1]
MSAEIDNTRMFFYDLIKSFFYTEPTEELYEKWIEIFKSMKSEELLFDDRFQQMLGFFDEVFKNYDYEKLKNEYYELFVNPFSDNLINLNASFYLDGKNFGETLVKLRDFLWKREIVKDEEFKDSEDSIVFLSDTMIYLIKSKSELSEQIEFFEKFIEPFFLEFAKALKNHPQAYFYASCGALIDFMLDVEKSLLSEGNLNGGAYET